MAKKISKPEYLFLIIGFIWGILYLVITPPFQVADENRHFYRAFQVAEGGWIPSTHEEGVGGWLPESVVRSGSSTSYMRWDATQKISRCDIINQFKEPLNLNDRIFKPFRSSAYTPVAYLPSASIIRIGIWCKFPPILLMYLGRIVNLICWLALVWISIRMVPFYKWVFFILALSPMSLYQAASLSADSVTNAIAFLTIAYFLYWIHGPETQMKLRHILLLFLLTISLSCTKNVFFLVSFLVLLIPGCKFANNKTHWLAVLALLVANITICFVWYEIVKKMPIIWRADVFPDQQIAYILAHPIAYMEVFISFLAWETELYIESFIGRFGWMDTPLTKLHYHWWELILLLTILTDGCEKITVRFIHRASYFFLFSVMCALIITLLYIYWNAIGTNVIIGGQGRYFIPIAPLLFLSLYNRRFSFTFPEKPIVFGLCSALFLTTALQVFYNRFYVL